MQLIPLFLFSLLLMCASASYFPLVTALEISCLFIVSTVKVIAIVTLALISIVVGECFLFPASDGIIDSPFKKREGVAANDTQGHVFVTGSVSIVNVATVVVLVAVIVVAVAIKVSKGFQPSFP